MRVPAPVGTAYADQFLRLAESDFEPILPRERLAGMGIRRDFTGRKADEQILQRGPGPTLL